MNVDEATNPGAGADVSDDAADDLNLGVVEGEEASEGEELEDDADGDDGDPNADNSEGGEDGDDDEELEELELNGRKYRVPPALVQERMMHADYTRKTQALAEQRTAFEADQTRQREVAEKTVEHRAKLFVIDQQLEALDNLDWGQAFAENPGRVFELQQQQRQLAKAKDDLNAEIKGIADASDKERADREAAATQQAQAAKLTRLKEGVAFIKQHIPDYSPAVAQKIASFGMKTFGFTLEELTANEDPRLVVLLHRAQQGAVAQRQKTQVQRQVTAQATQPAATVGGKAPARKNPNEMSTAEWMAHREKQLRKKGG